MLYSKYRSLFYTGVLTACLAAGPALSAEWRLVEVSGVVRVAAPGAEPTAGRVNQLLPTGSSVTTASGGRAKLDNGGKHIVLGANSRMIVAPASATGMDRVVQDLGSILFQIDKQAAPHFKVETPLLAAIVKGTTFTVVVGPQSDAVNVAEGLVEVRSNASNMGNDVPAGSTGTIFRDAPQAVQVAAPVAAVDPAPAAQPSAALDYKALTQGLVDSAPTAATAAQMQAATSGGRSEPASNGLMQSESAAMSTLAADVAMADMRTLSSGNVNVATVAGPNGGGPNDGAANDGGPSAGGGNSGDGANGNGPPGGNNGNGNTGGGATAGASGGTGNGNGNGGNGNPTGGENSGNGNTAGGGNNGNAGNGNGNGNGTGADNSGNGNAGGNGNGNNGNGNGNAGAGNRNGNGGNGNGADDSGNGNAGGNGSGGNGNNGNGTNGHGGGNGNSGSGNNGGGNGGNGGGVQVTLPVGGLNLELPILGDLGPGNENSGNGNGRGRGRGRGN